MGNGRYPAIKEKPSNVVGFPGANEKQISDSEVKQICKLHKPRGLSKPQQRVWDRTLPEVIRAGRFKPLYVDFYKQYAVTVERMERLLDFLDHPDNGWKYTTQGRNGTQHRPRPEAAQFNDDFRKWQSLQNQIGMSPATDQRFTNMQPDLFDEIY